MEQNSRKKWFLEVAILAILIAIPTFISQYFLYRDYQ